jgi:hypothetical protein
MGRRGKPKRVEAADIRFAAALLFFGYAITLSVWALHRSLAAVPPGQSTDRVAIMGALFGSGAALVEAFLKAPRGRAVAGLVGLAAAFAGIGALSMVLGRPDGSFLADCVPGVGGSALGSAISIVVLRLHSGPRARPEAGWPARPGSGPGPAAAAVPRGRGQEWT